MAAREMVLTDLATETWCDSFRLSAADEPSAPGGSWSLAKRTLRGGPSEGIDVVTLDNGELRLEVLPTRGMGILRGRYRDVELGWRSPVRFPVHPGLVSLTDRQGFGWLNGFNEWHCRCGLASVGGPDAADSAHGPIGATVNLHGRIANTPAHRVTARVDPAGAGTLSVTGEMDEAALFAGRLRLESTVSTTIGSNSFTCIDTVTNLGDRQQEVALLHHVNFGPPLLGAGAQVLAAVSEVAPYDEHSARDVDRWRQCDGPTPGAAQQCFFLRLRPSNGDEATIWLRDPTRRRGVRINFATDTLPCLTLWKNFAGERDGYVIGLEPGTCFPNPKSHERERGRVPVLAPGESRVHRFSITVCDDADAIAAATASLAESEPPRLHRHVNPSF
jgi:galactose mutarotase-like enzyme